jgi:hypothetical protein
MDITITSDAARRLSDAVSLAALNDDAGKWMAFKLSDGSTNNGIYDSRASAVAHTWWPELYCFIQVPPGGMQPREADAYLDYFRQLYDAGGRFHEPTFAMPLMPLTGADKQRQIRILTQGR